MSTTSLLLIADDKLNNALDAFVFKSSAAVLKLHFLSNAIVRSLGHASRPGDLIHHVSWTNKWTNMAEHIRLREILDDFREVFLQ